jgi:hypothetical protein
MDVDPELQEQLDRYHAAAYAMQSGVAMKMNIDDHETQPKHLRVGVNSAMSDNAALVNLLVNKGIITELEYYKAIADQMEIEKKMYEDELNTLSGTVNIHLS